MSFARPSPSSLRHPVRLSRSLLQLSQRRHARVHDVRFVTTHQPSSAVLEKYRSKLEQKAKQEGLTSVSELKEAYKDKIQEVRKQAAAVLPVNSNAAGAGAEAAAGGAAVAASSSSSSSTAFQQPPPPPPQPQPQAQAQGQTQGAVSGNGTGIKPLSSYLDISKIRELPAKEIEYIWRLRFASDPLSLCAVVPLSTYQRMQATARQHPQFILPLPRPDAQEGGNSSSSSTGGVEEEKEAAGARTAADVHFLQWAFHPPASGSSSNISSSNSSTSNTHTSTVIFTHLAAFKLHGPYAQPHTTITHHLDLADSHGIVLLNGGVVEGRGVSVEEGRWLLMCLQRFYDSQGQGSGSEAGRDKRQGLLEKFSKGDAGFSLEELVDEAERVR